MALIAVPPIFSAAPASVMATFDSMSPANAPATDAVVALTSIALRSESVESSSKHASTPHQKRFTCSANGHPRRLQVDVSERQRSVRHGGIHVGHRVDQIPDVLLVDLQRREVGVSERQLPIVCLHEE